VDLMTLGVKNTVLRDSLALNGEANPTMRIFVKGQT